MADDDRALACHWMLLRLAGTLPDDLMSQARTWLADGRQADIARAVVYAALLQRLPLLEEDLSVLGAVLVEAGADVSALAMIDVADGEPLPMVEFTADRASADAVWRAAGDAGPVPDTVTATGPATDGTGPVTGPDAVDGAAVGAAGEPGVLAMWRAWRVPADGSPWPPPRRVYVVEATAGVDLVSVTARIQAALLAAGERDPQVELYPTLAELPPYQRLARGYGALLWTLEPEQDVRLATLFDDVDPQHGPAMRPDHPHLDGADRDGVLDYLRNGVGLLLTEARMDDVVDAGRSATVPMNFLTDGHWVWTDAATYYLQRYGLSPDSDLVEHIRAREYRFSPVNGAAVHRALAMLTLPADEEPAWTFE
jgi:hypothetical protein